ncbi:hypothetical protein RUM43_009873 [Polyplax serrata]|uniref:Ubiquinol-cytochrome c chaperone domain-containing protein n=1 Tax=Polyplax serrata TaxID=468196 RepID=A0AAN8P7X5_POLSC
MNVFTRNIARKAWLLTNTESYYPLCGIKCNNFHSTEPYSNTFAPKTEISAIRKDQCMQNVNWRKTGAIPEDRFMDKMKKLMRKFSLFENKKMTLHGFLLYSTLEDVRIIEFMNLLELEDSFYSWFKITELHVWMLLVRLMQEEADLRKLRSALINAMWEDAHIRAKKISTGYSSLSSNFKQLNNEFKMVLFSYDEGLLGNDMILCNALWYYFFHSKCDDPQKLEALISYIRQQVDHLYLHQLSTPGKIPENLWLPLEPHLKSSG